MKYRTKLFLMLILVIGLISCSKEETKDILEGEWSLVRASGTIAGITVDYNRGDIIWDFGKNLKIESGDHGKVEISLPPGVYSYTVEKGKDGDELFINKNIYALVQKITKDSLTLTQNNLWSDGVDLVLVRN